MEWGEREGAGGRLGGLFPPREQVARAGRAAAWRHSDRTVATGKTTQRYYRLKFPVVPAKPTKAVYCYFIRALKQVQKFYKISRRLSTN